MGSSSQAMSSMEFSQSQTSQSTQIYQKTTQVTQKVSSSQISSSQQQTAIDYKQILGGQQSKTFFNIAYMYKKFEYYRISFTFLFVSQYRNNWDTLEVSKVQTLAISPFIFNAF